VQLTVVVPGAKVLPEAGVQVTVGDGSTKSVAVAENNTTAPAGDVAETVISLGTVKFGAVVSFTVTWKLLLPVLPCASVAEQVTDVMPRANVEPEAGAQVGMSTPSTRSLAEALKLTAAPDEPVASAVMSAGTVTIGAVVSSTVTSKSALPVLPAASVAEQVIRVVPNGKVSPEFASQVGVSAPSTLSRAEALKLTAAPDEPVASAVMSAGTVTTGGVVSCTVTLKLALPVLLWVSVAVQLTVVVPIGKVKPEAGEHDCELTASSGSLAEAL
jgi:hypothetical protein